MDSMMSLIRHNRKNCHKPIAIRAPFSVHPEFQQLVSSIWFMTHGHN